MAKRRMLSLQIVDTDAFLDMPTTAQALYFHLVVRADDEGFVDNPKKIMRLVNLNEDDLKVLIAKRFILTFKSGVVVIKHWLIHNTIRTDRFNKTVYVEERNSLILKENKAYTESGKPNGNQTATTGKHNINKININNNSKLPAKAGNDINILFSVFKEFNPTINYGNKTQRNALQSVIDEIGLDETKRAVHAAREIYGKKYAPVITTPLQLKNKLSQLASYIQRNK